MTAKLDDDESCMLIAQQCGMFSGLDPKAAKLLIGFCKRFLDFKSEVLEMRL